MFDCRNDKAEPLLTIIKKLFLLFWPEVPADMLGELGQFRNLEINSFFFKFTACIL